jgi:hypothetical protein
MPVLRNPQYYFREGFCWSDINTTYLKCRKKQKSINDVKSMSLYSVTETIPEYFFICIINSTFMSYYVDDFVNNTQTFQINDARQLPVVIPSKNLLTEFNNLFDDAIAAKKKQFSKVKSIENIEAEIISIQEKVDKKVVELYGII